MKPKGWTLLLLSLLAGAAAFCFWRAREENGVLQTRLAAVGRGATRLVSENTELQEAVRLAREESAAAQTALVTTRETLLQELAQKIDGGSSVTPEIVQRWLAEANDPTVMRRLNLRARYQTLRQYADLFDQLKLDSPVETRLTILLADKRQSAVDVAVTAFQRGEDLSQDPDHYRQIVGSAKDEIEKQIKTLIGEAAYQRYRDYDAAVAQANVLRNFELSLRGSSESLTAEQAAQVRQGLQGSAGSRITAQMVEDATAFLSPHQLQVLDDLRAVQQADEQRRIQRLQMELTPLPTGVKAD